MFTEEPIDSNRPTQFSRPREYSTYKGFTFVANSVNKDYENPGSNISDKISNKMNEVELMKKMMLKINYILYP